MIAPDSAGLYRSEPKLALWVVALSGLVLLPLAGFRPYAFYFFSARSGHLSAYKLRYPPSFSKMSIILLVKKSVFS